MNAWQEDAHTDILNTINVILFFSAFIITAMLMVGMLAGGNMKEPTSRLFFALLAASLLLNVGGMVAYFLVGPAGNPSAAVGVVVRLLDYAAYVIGEVGLVLYFLYICAFLRTKTAVSSIWVRLVVVFMAVDFVLATIALFNRMYSFFDENNLYHVAPTMWISFVFPALATTLNIIITLWHRKYLQRREFYSLLLYALIHIAGYILELAIPGLLVIFFGAAASMFLIYINIQLDLKQQMQQQVQAQLLETTKNRIAMMLSQIQPHFLYNSLTAICDLCEDNSDEQKALLVFSNYLRANMESLSQKGLIPFEKELEHTRQYLWLEQLRFGDALRVSYNIETTDFALPPLTLQPLVENAVRHGATKMKNGGNVRITVKEADAAYEIAVRDDGAGFAPGAMPADDGRHIGIDNVRGRVAAQCGGRLDIKSAAGTGTTVTIVIPKHKSAAEVLP